MNARERLKWAAHTEGKDPWFLAEWEKSATDIVAAEVRLRGAFYIVADMLDIDISSDEAMRWSSVLLHSPTDNVRSSLAHLPGYHTNSNQDSPAHREECAFRLFLIVARYILRQRRKWWQHPKFHVHHWKIQVGLFGDIRRAFERCSGCGRRLGYGNKSVIALGDGLFHFGCSHDPFSEGARLRKTLNEARSVRSRIRAALSWKRTV